MMKKNLKIFLGIGLILALVGFYIAYRMWNKPHADAAELQGIPVTAAELVQAFENDEASANTKYIGKVLEVSGTVSSINDQDSLVFVNLSYPEAMMGGVQVSVDARSAGEARNLKEGEQTTFKGFCNGYLMDVILKDAVLIRK
jgi:hypothetical protein